MSKSKNEVDSVVTTPDRRNFIRGAGAVLGVGALASFAPAANALSAPSASPESFVTSADSVLAKVLSSKKIKFGVDLTFAPLQFKKADGTPTGYIVDLANMLAQSLGATPEWVELPFGSLFAAQAAGKFDMSGISATIKPERAQTVLFASLPSFVESNYVLIKPGSKLKKLSDLNRSAISIAVVVGSSQESAAKLLYPKAKLKKLSMILFFQVTKFKACRD